MMKDLYIRQTVEHLNGLDRPRVTLAAEGNTDSFRVGDEVRLVSKDGTYCFLTENERMIPADICANVPQEEARKLAFVRAAFAIRRIAGNVIKAEMKNPYSLVHHGTSEWCYIH
ncbi:MAG: hypothetical protein Q4B44_01585 [Erysipelotrichaceae bacterium]|nr:hypothetical protein [Erysipelotrichaceae bacterium]